MPFDLMHAGEDEAQLGQPAAVQEYHVRALQVSSAANRSALVDL